MSVTKIEHQVVSLYANMLGIRSHFVKFYVTKLQVSVMRHYRRIQSCTLYRSFEFFLDKHLTIKHYTTLKNFIQTFGENTNPKEVKVLHIKYSLFFIDFPDYGFPVFKVSFYKTASLTQINDYLDLIDNYMDCIEFESGIISK